MHSITIFLGFCLALTVALALPSPPVQHGGSTASESHRLRPLKANIYDQQLKSVITLRHLATLQPRDWFSDLIRETLHLTVKELLAKTEETFKALDRVTNGGLQQLKEVIELATPAEQAEINKIMNSTIGGIFNQTNEFLKDLGLVLPNISSMKATRYDAAADIILALLGVSLEELIIAIANAMECSLELIDRAITDLTALAEKAGPDVEDALREISNNFKTEGSNWLIPMVDQLHQLVSSSGSGCSRSSQNWKAINIQSGDDMLDKTVSLMLGIKIKTAAFQVEDVLPKLINILESTRDVLDQTLAPEVQTKVMAIYDNAIDKSIRQAKPIFTTLLQFQEPARRDHTFVYNLLNSVLGVGLDNFKNYLRFASNQIKTTIKKATTEMFVESISGGIMPALDVWKILHGKLIAAKLVSKPLLDTLKPLFESPEEEYKEGSDEWSNPDGTLFNRDALINTVSRIMTFNVSDATRELKIALQGLDSLMEVSLLELDQILTYEETHLRSEILGIMNNTLTEIHIALQPMFDVLLPFLPDTTRSNRDIALNIYTAINRLDGTQFLQYCSLTATKIPLLTSEATYLIQTAASKASNGVQTELIDLLQRSDEQTDVILKPFLDSLGHIITPF